MATATRKAPWKKSNPKTRAGTSRALTPAQKSSARRAAAKAGRPYPNLVDNMHAAAKGKSRGKTRSKTAARPKRALKDPHGGLTAAGRAAFRRRDGSHLRPGVKTSEREMSSIDKKRKGSWAVRFYGRAGRLPPLKDKAGRPTRFALSAAAWGEPVPTTAAAARKIAAKGRRLLSQYRTEMSQRSRRS
jgi:hypothetical protein